MPPHQRRRAPGMHVVRVLGKLEPGGAQLAILRLSRELARRHGVRTTLLVGDATPEGLRLAAQHGVKTLALRSRTSIPAVRNLQWELSADFASWLSDKLEGADLVHAHMVGAWWAVAQVIDESVPFAASEHNEVNWTARRTGMLRLAAARIHSFFAMGPAARQFALDAGVRADVISAARSPVAGMSTVPHGVLPRPRLTFAGRLCRDKGPDVLVEAVALLGESDLAVYLLGAGPLAPRLSSLIRRRGLSHRVFMPGWVERPWSYVAGSTVHVVPSREEAWSQSAVLGLGLGVPVVGTRVDGLEHTLAQSRGVLVEPDDPSALAAGIAAVLNGSVRIDRGGALRYARRFSAAHVADFYLGEYQALQTAMSS